MTGATRAPRRLTGIGDVGFYDAVYVSTCDWDAPLSCAGRIASDNKRGLRSLMVTVHAGADVAPAGGDLLALGVPTAVERNPGVELFDPRGSLAGEEETVIDLARRLEEVFRRSRARSLFLPLGVGGHIDSLVSHEGGLRTFHAGTGRDVYLYEERPDAFVSGSVRIRLAQLGARLPPAAARVTAEGGLLRLLLRTQTVPRLRDSAKGIGPRVEVGRRVMRCWFAARGWRPLRALGPRLQPVVFSPEAPSLAAARALVIAVGARFGGHLPDRLLALGADHARRLGGGEWAERFWLLLPQREGAMAAHAIAPELVDLVS